MKAIIPTGGRGTRMQPLTFSSNKHFIPVGGKPLIYYPIEAVVAAGIKDILITYNPGYLDQVKSFLGDGSKWEVKITYVLQEKPIGLANIVEVCEEALAGNSFVLHLGDNIFVDGITEAVNYFREKKPNGLVTMLHHPENKRMGVPYFDKNWRLIKYIEKPENPPHDFAVPGIYFADSNFFKCFKGADRIKPSARGEYEIPAAFQWMIDHNLRVDVIEYKGKWLDPGKFDDWIEANQYLLDRNVKSVIEGKVDEQSTVENRVSIGQGSEIQNSHLRGPVSIGKNVKVINSFVGPYTSINDDCSIEGSHLENSVLMNGVSIINVGQPIDTSLIGSGTEIRECSGPTESVQMFVGEKCKITV